MLRSAQPLPCAIQVPETVRMMGCLAVTRPLHLDAYAAAQVYVGFSIGNDHHVPAAHLAAQDSAREFRCPGNLRCIARVGLSFQFIHQPLQVTRDRAKPTRRLVGVGLRLECCGIAPQQCAHGGHPAMP